MMTFYVGICVMLFGGGAFIAFFTRLLISLFADETVNPEKILLFSIVFLTIIAVGAILTVIGHFLKKKQAAAPAAPATATDAVEATVELVVEDVADAASAPAEDAAEQPRTPEEI